MAPTLVGVAALTVIPAENDSFLVCRGGGTFPVCSLAYSACSLSFFSFFFFSFLHDGCLLMFVLPLGSHSEPGVPLLVYGLYAV